MAETFALLLLAHLVADFPLQTDTMVRSKKQWRVFLCHMAIVAGLTLVALGSFQRDAICALTAILITHAVIDFFKLHLPDRWWAFVLDQLLHVIVLAAVSATWPHLANSGIWGAIPSDAKPGFFAGVVQASGLVATIWTGIVIVKLGVRGFDPEARAPAREAPDAYVILYNSKNSSIAGQAGAGRAIGMLERALAFLLILTGQPEGVGFLLAAKSILRFREISTDSDRRRAEYVIIGTLMSFGWALGVAALTQAALAHWRPPAPAAPSACVQCPAATPAR